MNPKRYSSIRPLGQRSIPSTFIFSSSNRSDDCKKTADTKPSKGGSHVSLSEFLNRKLHRSSVLPGSAQGKERPFLSPVSCKDVKSIKGETSAKETSNGEKDFPLDIVLEQFKHSKTEKKGFDSVDSVELRSATRGECDIRDSGKRKRGDYREPAKKLVAVLGDDSVTRRGGRKKILASNEKQKFLYDHYANGGGWWDCGMEGVDNEELGSAEVWEGMGCTTLGGLDWH